MKYFVTDIWSHLLLPFCSLLGSCVIWWYNTEMCLGNCKRGLHFLWRLLSIVNQTDHCPILTSKVLVHFQGSRWFFFKRHWHSYRYNFGVYRFSPANVQVKKKLYIRSCHIFHTQAISRLTGPFHYYWYILLLVALYTALPLPSFLTLAYIYILWLPEIISTVFPFIINILVL